MGYRITVAGRDGKLYHIRNGELTQTIIQLEAQPVGLVRAGACMYYGVCIRASTASRAAGRSPQGMPNMVMCFGVR